MLQFVEHFIIDDFVVQRVFDAQVPPLYLIFVQTVHLSGKTDQGRTNRPAEIPTMSGQHVLFNIKLHFYWGGHIVKWVLGK